MKNIVWHSGPPPHVGWWNASTSNFDFIFRWWNGEEWSDAASSNTEYTAREINTIASIPYGGSYQRVVKWSHYYPENAIIDRVDPVTGIITGKSCQS